MQVTGNTSPVQQNAYQPSAEAVQKAEDTREAFSKWVGETFYAHMLKSMRSTVGEPAYFHSGHAEETFRSQLDMQLAQEFAETSGDRFANPMFEQAFPQQAAVLKHAESLSQLDNLPQPR